MRRILLGAVFGLGTAAVVAPANASIILSLVGNPVAVTGGFDYTYSATLSSDEQLDKTVQPVFFTLYDFGASKLVTDTGDLAVSGAWAFTLNVNQTTSAQAVSPNNTSLFDVRANYSGPTLLGSSLSNTPGNLGTFTLFTTSTGPYAIFNNNQDAQLEKLSPGSPTNDTPTSNIAAVAVPTLGRTLVPEPASLAMLGAGLAGLAFMRRRRSAI